MREWCEKIIGSTFAKERRDELLTFNQHQSSTMSTLTAPEQLQSVILHTLDSQGSIPDTRVLSLTLPLSDSTTRQPVLVGPSLEAQNAVKGVLDSLLAKEVNFSSSLSLSFFLHLIKLTQPKLLLSHVDDHVQTNQSRIHRTQFRRYPNRLERFSRIPSLVFPTLALDFLKRLSRIDCETNRRECWQRRCESRTGESDEE